MGSLARICPIRSFWLTSAISFSLNSWYPESPSFWLRRTMVALLVRVDLASSPADMSGICSMWARI